MSESTTAIYIEPTDRCPESSQSRFSANPRGRAPRSNRGLTVKGLRGHRSAYLAKLAITRHHEIVMLTGYRYGNSYMGLARFSRRGHLDRRFSRNGFFVSRSERKTPGAPLEPTDITLRPNGRIVVSAIGFLDGENFMVRQYRPDGRADRSFFGNGVMARKFGDESGARSVLSQRDGKVVAGGYVESGNESGPLPVRFKAVD